jgi:hypothetical protein
MWPDSYYKTISIGSPDSYYKTINIGGFLLLAYLMKVIPETRRVH